MLLDEPTEGIQPNIVEQIEKVLLALNRDRGMTIVLVEQNVEFARRASKRFMIMDRGSVAAQGSVQDLTDDLVHRHMTV
jgi:urea transport system ATP-binding protein